MDAKIKRILCESAEEELVLILKTKVSNIIGKEVFWCFRGTVADRERRGVRSYYK